MCCVFIESLQSAHVIRITLAERASGGTICMTMHVGSKYRVGEITLHVSGITSTTRELKTE